MYLKKEKGEWQGKISHSKIFLFICGIKKILQMSYIALMFRILT